MGDFTYRTREEVDAWRARCPIAALRNRLLEEGLAEASDLEAIDTEIRQQVQEAHQWAEQSPWPSPETATQHVYEEGC
jgi:2-oxoisovalerate dehydrogenase E1 component